ncbi:lasso RiPP family leader peptide-containing protein [Streptomyces mayteni]
MEHESRIEESEVYEPPVLAEVGGFAEQTRGWIGDHSDGFVRTYAGG